ncbi:MAG: ABC transporter substrate-binding protein, partial [Cyanothece sp. SIO2G6]|nr:ABC transporter substrate-binding protein [Cyanothece sp. SIO2G6]
MKTLGFALLGSIAVCLTGCGGPSEVEADAESGLVEVTLQLDWYAEPAHGGFYQALVKGFYKEEGLAVDIKQGGPGIRPLPSVTVGGAEFALSRIDDTVIGIDQGLPLKVAMAYMQKDPQAIMFHASNPIDSWEDLDGKAIMIDPGSAMVSWLKKRYEIEFDIIPLDFGIARFLADKGFIQQCFITSQPYFAELQGAEVGAKLLADEAFSP